MILFLSSVLAFLGYLSLVAAQECGLPCVADVSGTGCSPSEWSCLCGVQAYLEKLSTCAKGSCDPQDYDLTIGAVAQLCNIFDNSATISPYATATFGTENPILSTVAVSTSLPPASSPTPTTGSQEIAGTSISVFTTTGVPTDSSAAASATSSTPTNIAQRVDLRSAALQGIAVALLGLAMYL